MLERVNKQIFKVNFKIFYNLKFLVYICVKVGENCFKSEGLNPTTGLSKNLSENGPEMAQKVVSQNSVTKAIRLLGVGVQIFVNQTGYWVRSFHYFLQKLRRVKELKSCCW